MKKTISLILSALFLLSVLTGCGNAANTAPSGDMPGEPPEGGEGPGGTPPGDPPDGNGGPGGTPPGGFGGGMPGGGPGSSSSADIDYPAAVEITSADSQSGQTYSSTTSDESALLISTDADVTITDPTVTKTGDSDGGDNCNFYGLNAAVLVKDGATVTINGGTVTSVADGANGVFCYGGNGGQNGASGDGTTLYIYDTVITTTGDGSGGIMTTGGGVTYAYDLDVTTSGRPSAPTAAAVRSWWTAGPIPRTDWVLRQSTPQRISPSRMPR